MGGGYSSQSIHNNYDNRNYKIGCIERLGVRKTVACGMSNHSYIAPDKALFFSRKILIISYFCTKTYVVGTH